MSNINFSTYKCLSPVLYTELVQKQRIFRGGHVTVMLSWKFKLLIKLSQTFLSVILHFEAFQIDVFVSIRPIHLEVQIHHLLKLISLWTAPPPILIFQLSINPQ